MAVADNIQRGGAKKPSRFMLVAGVFLALFVQAGNSIGFFFLLPRITAMMQSLGDGPADFITSKSFVGFSQLIQQVAWLGVPVFIGLAGFHLWAICQPNRKQRLWAWLVVGFSMLLWFCVVSFLAWSITKTTFT